MSSSSSRPVRSYRRRNTNLELDLNRVPPVENVREDEGTSSAEPQQQQELQVPMIDVEAIDEDVVESSPRAFAQATTNARRTRRRTTVDVDSEDRTREARNDHHRYIRGHPMQPISDRDLFRLLEGSSSSEDEEARKSPEPLEVPVVNCPICMAPFAEEMSTRCGHIFCKQCIKTAIAAQGKCPTCRKKVNVRELIRVFLPAAS